MSEWDDFRSGGSVVPEAQELDRLHPEAIRGLPQAHIYDETQYYEKADCPPYYCCATCIERGFGIRYASDPIHVSNAGAAPEALAIKDDPFGETLARELIEARQAIGRLTLEAEASRTYANNVAKHVNEYLQKIASLEQQLSALKASHAELEQDKDAAEMRLERIRTPKVYEGTYYTNAPIPEYCPECDGRTFISAGPRGMVCYICSLLAANEELESEKAAAHEAGFAEALEAAAEVCHRMGDETDADEGVPDDEGPYTFGDMKAFRRSGQWACAGEISRLQRAKAVTP